MFKFSVPHGAKLYYSYPKTRVITVYGSVGEIIATYRFQDEVALQAAEKYLNKKLINSTLAMTPKQKKAIISQFSLSKRFIRYWNYEEILESIYCYDLIKRCSRGAVPNYKGFYWKVEFEL